MRHSFSNNTLKIISQHYNHEWSHLFAFLFKVVMSSLKERAVQLCVLLFEYSIFYEWIQILNLLLKITKALFRCQQVRTNLFQLLLYQFRQILFIRLNFQSPRQHYKIIFTILNLTNAASCRKQQAWQQLISKHRVIIIRY